MQNTMQNMQIFRTLSILECFSDNMQDMQNQRIKLENQYAVHRIPTLLMKALVDWGGAVDPVLMVHAGQGPGTSGPG